MLGAISYELSLISFVRKTSFNQATYCASSEYCFFNTLDLSACFAILFLLGVTVQLPRLYNIYKSMGTVTSFQNILDNVFIPLFEVSVDPKSHPQLHIFLMQVNYTLFVSNTLY